VWGILDHLGDLGRFHDAGAGDNAPMTALFSHNQARASVMGSRNFTGLTRLERTPFPAGMSQAIPKSKAGPIKGESLHALRE